MKTNLKNHCRKTIRLKGYDYSSPGAYFVTICTISQEPFFGIVIDGEMHFNDSGRIAVKCWSDLPHSFPGISLDKFVLMPNHFHGIVNICEDCAPVGRIQYRSSVGAQFIAPEKDCSQTKNNAMSDHAVTLGTVVRSFKASASRHIRLSGMEHFRWQRNYYEHIIRNEKELDKIREYIANNPLRWELDRENPDRSGEDDFDKWIRETGRNKSGRDWAR